MAGKTTQRKSNRKEKKASPCKTGLVKFIFFLLSVLLIVLIVSSVVVGYVFAYAVSYTNGDPALNLDEYKSGQSQTSFIFAYGKDGKPVEYARLHGGENRVWVDIEKMPEHLQKAFISLEDKRFYEHKGVDWVRFAGVITKYNFDQGGSTITQQLIKNLTNEKDVTVVRKFNEIMSALNLEKNYSKTVILETYLNTIPLGNGCYGVETAAEKYFGKTVSQLNLTESACLASITQAPSRFDPLTNPENNKERREYCLREMYAQGAITQQEYQKALAYKVIFTNSPDYVPSGSDNKEQKQEKKEYQSYYVDFVIDNVIDDLREKYGYSLYQATNKIYYGGLKIYCAVDLDIQKQMEEVYYNRITMAEKKGTAANPAAQSAMTIMDYQGRVVGIIGGAGPKPSNRCLNRAADSPRQPGSSIKPLSVYSPGIESGKITWSTKFLDKSCSFINGRPWPQNYSGTLGSGGRITVQYAIQESVNTVAARILINVVTPKTGYEYLRDKYHITTLDPDRDIAAPPLAVGALTNGVTTLEMAAAYAAFGNGGKYYAPYCYYKVTDSTGSQVLLETNPKGEQIISPATSDVMCELLQTVDTDSFGSGSTLRKFQVMAKTGSTDEYKDRWTIAGTPYYISATWYGYDKPKPIPRVGPNPAGKMFYEVFNRIHKGLKVKTFPKSGDTVLRRYCTDTGLLNLTGCSSTKLGWYINGKYPGRSYDSNEQGATTTTLPVTTTKPAVTTTKPPTTVPTEPETTLPPVTTTQPDTTAPVTTQPPATGTTKPNTQPP
ncbi:MAG TPA: transglycosylase domain-containing protein [Clostridiales bacterium]|nr:transglycosylase domain-containing protein [Clostridiales bacterium]HQK73332.1 transglycosylase domain-containing protein [Clostridiales bacterium]